MGWVDNMAAVADKCTEAGRAVQYYADEGGGGHVDAFAKYKYGQWRKSSKPMTASPMRNCGRECRSSAAVDRRRLCGETPTLRRSCQQDRKVPTFPVCRAAD